MVRAWYIPNSNNNEDLEVENETLGPEISLLELFQESGVETFEVNLETYDTDGKLDKIRAERGYNYHDVIHICEKVLPNYEERVKGFHTEHLHSEEEIRLVLDGTTYFDIRTRKEDQWIRILIIPGDLIILPAGIYHRLTLLSGKTVKLLRLFQDRPIWSAYNRPIGDELECRKNYLKAQMS